MILVTSNDKIMKLSMCKNVCVKDSRCKTTYNITEYFTSNV